MLSWLPPNASSYGAEIDQIFRVIYYVTALRQITIVAYVEA